MNRNDFLLEIHTEELPPKSLLKLSNALAENIKLGLEKAQLEFGEVSRFSTPRRLAVIVANLAECQPDQLIERKGPALQAAYDQSGKPTQACVGFAKSCGVEVADLETMKTEKGEFLYFKKTDSGKRTVNLLPEIVEQALKQLPVAKMMKWSTHEVPFVRPVHSVLMMYGSEKIDATILGKETTRETKGHRVHGKQSIRVKSPKKYVHQLKNEGAVITDFDARRDMIEAEIIRLAKKHRGKAFIERALLDEVTALVEWPVALVGRFPKKYLKLPKEVLISSMQAHQRCFSMLNEKNQLMPFFITISNVKSANPDLVIKGNERVMVARLADAEFFYDADCMQKLSRYREELRNVVFQAQLGSLYDKTERIKILSHLIATSCGFDVDDAERAAILCKSDLMTSMVGEFPELQGIMGSYYAEHDAERQNVVAAMTEQYMPLNADAPLPATNIGTTIALADRIDTLVGIFGIGKAPTGDKDPFGLRRAALGVIRLLLKPMPVSLEALLKKSKSLYGDLLVNPIVVEDVLNFIFDRLKYWLLAQEYSANQIAAVQGAGVKELPDFLARLDAVQKFQALPEAESLAAANKRVHNILAKERVKVTHHEIDVDLLREDAERKLAKQVMAEEQKEYHTYHERLIALAKLREPIDQFFDKVMVMVEDEALRHNRLVLLSKLRALFLKVADVSLL